MENAITDPRWQDLVAKYQNNWPLAMQELLGYEPTKQQKLVLENAQGNSTMTTVSVGEGVGTTTLAAAILIIRTILYPMSQAYVCNGSPLIPLIIKRNVLPMWNYALKKAPWLDNYFELSKGALVSRTERFWQGSHLSTENPEALAGALAEHLFYIVLNASDVSDECFGVIRAGLTEKDNGLILFSIPDPEKNSGHFYDSHHKLAKGPGNPCGMYTAISLNAEDSPLVTPEYLDMVTKRYGGKDTDKYRSRVQGRFSGINSVMARFPITKFMNVTMPDNSVWQIPTEVIARHHAAYYAKKHDISLEDSLERYTLPLFQSDTYEIEDWATNNMNWSDVQPHATMIRPGEVDFDDGWANGDKTFSKSR